MELREALERIDEIHGHLAKAEVYRGYRAVPVATSGLIAAAACAAQAAWTAPGDSRGYLAVWLGAAALAALACGAGIIFHYVYREDAAARRRTLKVLGQFAPSLAAGAAVTVALDHAGGAAIGWLPGLWATLFGLGVFASRPFLPRAIGWVGLFYLSAGAALLWAAPSGLALAPWGMGATFGLGQIAAAAVLYWNIERVEADRQVTHGE